MKATAPTAIALTLLMFVIVLAATVFFLFQRQQTLQGNLENADAEIRTMQQQQAESELNSAAAQSTYEVLEASGTAAAAENAQLADELVQLDQDSLTRDARESQLSLDQENANATVQSFESLGPLITLVEPDADSELIAGEPVELVIVASDHSGVNNIDFTIGNEPILQGGPVDDGQLTAVKRQPWTPEEAGTVEVRITAINVNGIKSDKIISLVVVNPTVTPESTIEATAEPAATATP
jgi:hypothetical protein